MSFNFEVVFSSLQNFLGSGYVGLAVIIMLVFGALNKLRKLLSLGIVASVVWLVCSTGLADKVLAQLGLG